MPSVESQAIMVAGEAKDSLNPGQNFLPRIWPPRINISAAYGFPSPFPKIFIQPRGPGSVSNGPECRWYREQEQATGPYAQERPLAGALSYLHGPCVQPRETSHTASHAQKIPSLGRRTECHKSPGPHTSININLKGYGGCGKGLHCLGDPSTPIHAPRHKEQAPLYSGRRSVYWPPRIKHFGLGGGYGRGMHRKIPAAPRPWAPKHKGIKPLGPYA